MQVDLNSSEFDGVPIASYGGGNADNASAADHAEELYEEYQDDITGIVLTLRGGGSDEDAHHQDQTIEPKI